MKISVVIPTVGRPELDRAIKSARAQLGPYETEVIVVVDGAVDSLQFDSETAKMIDTVTWTGGGKGGSYARNLGVQAADGDWVAFLDDDDEWLPDKTRAQLQAASHHGGQLVVLSSQHIQIDTQGNRSSGTIPKHVISTGRPIAEYLFARRRAGAGRASMYTSTLMCPRDLARMVPWNAELRRHQDWDWLLRLGRQPGVQFVQVPSPLVRIQSGSSGSISASPSWRDSLAWVDSQLVHESRRVYVDFLTAQTLRYAFASRSFTGARAVARRLVRARRLPSAGPIAIALAGLLPRKTIERLMMVIR